MGLLTDTHIWFAFSFVVFLALAWKFGKGSILNMLDSRIQAIRNELREAENLRIEAQEMLAQYQRKHRDVVQEAEKIIKTAEKQAMDIREKAMADLEESLARREKQLQERLGRLQQNAKDEIQEYAANLAVAATAEIIADKLDQKTNIALVDQAIKDVSKQLN